MGPMGMVAASSCSSAPQVSWAFCQDKPREDKQSSFFASGQVGFIQLLAPKDGQSCSLPLKGNSQLIHFLTEELLSITGLDGT